MVAVVALREPNGHVAAVQSQQTSSASNVAKNSSSSEANSSTGSAGPGRRTKPAAGDPQPSASVKDVPLVVLNNTTVQGLAEQAAHRFESGGWTVTSFGNYQNEIASTCAYFDPSYAGAKAAAEALQRQYPTITRVQPRFAPDGVSEPLPDAPVVVVLTPDYSSI
jgi:hypothetical protein